MITVFFYKVFNYVISLTLFLSPSSSMSLYFHLSFSLCSSITDCFSYSPSYSGRSRLSSLHTYLPVLDLRIYHLSAGTVT